MYTGLELAPIAATQDQTTDIPLAGMDVHAIPARKGEPYHLHHDLIFGFTAESDRFAITDEAPQVTWCGVDEFARYDLAPSVIRAARRALRR